MAYVEGFRKDGSKWTPRFVESIDSKKCIGCGRCFKACGYGVLSLFEDEEDDDARAYMIVKDDGKCIGCYACATACPKGCFTHKPKEI